MADEVPVEAETRPETPIQVPEVVIEQAPESVEAPTPEVQTAQIPANEPIATPPPQPSVIAPVLNLARDLAAKARAVIQGRKRKKLDKILEYVTKHGSVTNDQVEKLLHVSDATATRYLTQLVKEQKLKQVGKMGKSVKYEKL